MKIILLLCLWTTILYFNAVIVVSGIKRLRERKNQVTYIPKDKTNYIVASTSVIGQEQPGLNVRGDDSFPLASPVNIEPYPLKAKPFPVPNMGGVTDEEGLKVYDNSAPNWNEKAREKLGLEKEKKT